MRKLIAGLALAVMTAGSAMAGDLEVRPQQVYAPPAPPIPVYSWTGFYIGVHGGGDWFNKDWFIPLSAINAVAGCPGCPSSAGTHRSSSWLAGVQVGFNYQIDWWVSGVEVQASWTRLESSNANANPAFAALGFVNHSKTDSVGTIAARLGAAWDRTLLYVKGGGAWAEDKFFTTTAAFPGGFQSVADTRWGWMVGVGVEYAFFHNWSVKLEYDHLHFSRITQTLQPIAPGATQFEFDIWQTIDLVKVGVNYRFGAPVVPRYY